MPEDRPQDKLLQQMMDSLRTVGLSQQETLNACLFILGWTKLSISQAMPEHLRISSKLLEDQNKTRDALKWLGTHIDQDFRIPDGLKPTLDIALRAFESGLVADLDVADVVEDFVSAHSFERVLSLELANFLIGLAQISEDDSVYTPWDRSGQLASRAASLAKSVTLESPESSSVAAWVSILSARPFDVKITDPIKSPSATEAGRLRKFDVAVSFPPLGLRVVGDVVDYDWFGRFSERTSSGSVLAVRHLIAQSCRKVVVALPGTVLFSDGVEKSLREDLIKKKMVECVISMPGGLLGNTRMPFAVLVLDVTGSSEQVRFVDADSPQFREPISKARARLANIDQLLELCSNNVESERSATASVQSIQDRDSVLMVSGYVFPDSTRRVFKLMDSMPLKRLKEVVKTVRPLISVLNKTEGIQAYEIGAADLPTFGYITHPGRAVIIDPKSAKKGMDQFLRPLDIVLIVKGSVGKVGIVPESVPAPGEGGWVAGQSAIVLRCRGDAIDPRAIAVQMRSELGQAVLKLARTGATIPMIPLKMLMELPIFVPDRLTAEKAKAALDIETELQGQIETLRKTQANAAKDLWIL